MKLGKRCAPITNTKCRVDGCGNLVIAKQLCRKHYLRMNRTGTLESSFRLVKAFDRYGRLTTVRQAPSPRNKWLCKCACGNEVIVFASNLTRGHSTSCGCSRRERMTTHGKSTSAEYRAWTNIRTRCENPDTPYWGFYGGRGIQLCERWHRFENFLSDMGPRPPNRSIDRINVDGDYEPGNCRWATQSVQCRNKREQHFVLIDGRQISLAEAVERSDLRYNTVLYRIKRGWSVLDALKRRPR
jgi:hypothetical protein